MMNDSGPSTQRDWENDACNGRPSGAKRSARQIRPAAHQATQCHANPTVTQAGLVSSTVSNATDKSSRHAVPNSLY